jgi:hypothetical protein
MLVSPGPDLSGFGVSLCDFSNYPTVKEGRLSTRCTRLDARNEPNPGRDSIRETAAHVTLIGARRPG